MNSTSFSSCSSRVQLAGRHHLRSETHRPGRIKYVAPPESWASGGGGVSVRLSVRLSVCLSVCPSVRLFVCSVVLCCVWLSVCLSLCLLSLSFFPTLSYPLVVSHHSLSHPSIVCLSSLPCLAFCLLSLSLPLFFSLSFSPSLHSLSLSLSLSPLSIYLSLSLSQRVIS